MFALVLFVGFLGTVLTGLLLVLFLCLGCFVAYQAYLRKAIREKLHIRGDFCSDCIHHTFCACCSVCQESREAKRRNMPKRDLCCGDLLDSLSTTSRSQSPLPDTVIGESSIHSPMEFYNELSTTTISFTHDLRSSLMGSETSEITLREQISKLSMTGRFICYIWGILTLTTIFSLSVGKHPTSIFVLLLVFLQPAVILYIIYWRNFREAASLDYVIKLFTCGFFLATTQAIVLEEILQVTLEIVIHLSVAFEEYIGVGDVSAGATAATKTFLSQYIMSFRHHGPMFSSAGASLGSFRSTILQSGFHITGWLGYMHHNTAFTAYGSVQDVHSMYTYTAYMEEDTDKGVMSTGGLGVRKEEEQAGDGDDMAISYMTGDIDPKKHFAIVVIALAIMAYVIAAGVEETTKHFVVHCYQFPDRLRDPRTVLIFLLCAALGFETAENIEYVFGTTVSPVRRTSLVVGELFVLGLRQLMPIHAICSVLQAAEYAKVQDGNAYSEHTFFVLLPAILLHGTFDFMLFLLGAIQGAFNVNNFAFNVLSFAIPLVMTVGGMLWAYWSFKRVLRGSRDRGAQWTRAATDDNIDM